MRQKQNRRKRRRRPLYLALALSLGLTAGCSRWQPDGGSGAQAQQDGGAGSGYADGGGKGTGGVADGVAGGGNGAADGGNSAANGGNSAGSGGNSAADGGNGAADGGSGANGGNGAADGGNSAANGGNGTGGKSAASSDGQSPCAEIIHRDQEAQSGGGDVKLPSAYDYRKTGRAPQIGNQGSLGTCWAFASLKALESSLLPGKSLELSVDHMTLHNSFSMSQDAGGEYTMSMAYLLAWQGPVLESEDPYGDGYSPDGLKPCLHVQDIQILPAKDYEAIKQAVYRYGGVQSSLYTSMRNYQSESVYYNRTTNSYCYIGDEKPNHDSVIIGWDDNYSKDNFNMGLEGDGAFICTNSWGEDFGDQGYFYVSYYDTNIGVHNIVYTGVEPADNYDHNYQSDLCGWVGQIGYGRDSAWFANAYTAGKGENLEAAGFYATDQNTDYELYVARHLGEKADQTFGQRVKVAEGRLRYAGFYTIPLDQKIVLDDGEKFAIIVKITTPGTVHPVAIEYDAGDGMAEIDLSDGEGYLSFDGDKWEHVEETQKCNVCLKAYTSNR
ncbi:lectin like domain-containing protein [Enterocloster asparagiformis]|uniref:Papain family cysteine protease n=2 Tax=Enterocloster asparagiformis TaxID=333367 RepID=C0CWL7_9FIRM|nr:lectin like domain-containing protein [Enterocloster asparagiformis]EEG56537.1 papain family cysteine protease [[Clostridium] asparagiforme DSM 15981]UWO75688.1 lectin like domain-containing protein [[Clostridium] asparagiforme DSM 15981]